MDLFYLIHISKGLSFFKQKSKRMKKKSYFIKIVPFLRMSVEYRSIL